MTLTEDQYFAKGATALKLHIAMMQKEIAAQIVNLRAHYETGHNGKHPTPENNTPLNMMYTIMGDQMMEMQFLRQMDPLRFQRAETVYWLLSAQTFSTIYETTTWATWQKEMEEGLDNFVERQNSGVDQPALRERITRTGKMIHEAEVASGKSFDEMYR